MGNLPDNVREERIREHFQRYIFLSPTIGSIVCSVCVSCCQLCFGVFWALPFQKKANNKGKKPVLTGMVLLLVKSHFNGGYF